MANVSNLTLCSTTTSLKIDTRGRQHIANADYTRHWFARFRHVFASCARRHTSRTCRLSQRRYHLGARCAEPGSAGRQGTRMPHHHSPLRCALAAQSTFDKCGTLLHVNPRPRSRVLGPANGGTASPHQPYTHTHTHTCAHRHRHRHRHRHTHTHNNIHTHTHTHTPNCRYAFGTVSLSLDQKCKK